MSVADAHIHLFGLSRSTAEPDDLALYEELREIHDVEKALVIGFEGEARFAGNTDHILELARSRRWLVPLAYLDTARPPTVEELRAYRDRGAAGFALYASTERDASAFSSFPEDVLQELREHQAIVSINAPPQAISVFSEAVRRLEGCCVLFSHLGLPGRFRARPTVEQARQHLAPLLDLAQCSGVAVKFSGLYAIDDLKRQGESSASRSFVDVVLEAFGPGRIVWGSDFPPVLSHGSFERTRDTALLSSCTSWEVEQIMGRNLLRLLDARTAGA